MAELGTVGWVDITVPDADKLKDFYCSVIGWTPKGLDMGRYEDFVMSTPGGTSVAGVCHARGSNADIPPVWLVYFMVKDVAASAELCKANGGEVLVGPKPVGGGQFAVIRDPAGAVCALYQA
jgi:predicted enzyme related to lactoylglutathione lyase